MGLCRKKWDKHLVKFDKWMCISHHITVLWIRFFHLSLSLKPFFFTSHMAIFKSLYCLSLKTILFQVRPCFLSHNSSLPMILSGFCISVCVSVCVCAFVCLADRAGGLTFSPEAYQPWQMKGTALWASVALSNCLLTPLGDVNSLEHEAYRYANWTNQSWQRTT